MARRLLLVVTVAATLAGDSDIEASSAALRCSPCCGGNRLLYRELPPADAPSAAGVAQAVVDTS